MKIYTKTGDDGTTALFSGGRVDKTHPRVEAYGTVDELNSVIGLARALKLSAQADTLLEKVQNQLFVLGADLATPHDAKSAHIVRIDSAAISWLENSIDELTAELPAMTHFILPGGTPAAAQLHVARTVCRRAERLVVAITEAESIGDLPQTYLNRLSDWLFTLSRWENFQQGVPEEQWIVRGE